MLDAPAMDASAAVDVGIRPHDVEVCPASDAHTSGRIELVEPLGPTLLLHVRIDALADRLLRVLAPADLPVAREGPVHLRFATVRLHLFDAGSGRRMIA
jgi:ABC-type sugar transport system ATPase subunit